MTSNESQTSISRLTSGNEANNLHFLYFKNEGAPDSFWLVNEEALDGVFLKDITPSSEERKNTSIIQVENFLFDPKGEQLLIFFLGKDMNSIEIEVLIYQKVDGKLHRLTSVSEKVHEFKFVLYCNILNHPEVNLTELSEKDGKHYMGVGLSFPEEGFSLQEFEKRLLNKNNREFYDKGSIQYNNYKLLY